MKLVKRVLGITFLLAAILGGLIFNVSATEVVASGYCGGEGDGTNLSWSLDNQGTLTINGNGAMASYKSFNPPWKSKLSSIRALIIGDGVTSIGHSAFKNACYLDSISIGNSVASIGAYAFYEVYGGNHTGYRFSVIMPSSVQLIAENAFPYVERIYFEGNAPEIMNNAFNESATIYYVSGLTGWTDSQAYDVASNTWNDYKLSIWENQSILGSGYCGGESNGMNLTWELTTNGILTIHGNGEMVNYRYHTSPPWYPVRTLINEVVIGSGITTIGNYSFTDCSSLTSASIPSGITHVGESAFNNCHRLPTVNLPDGISAIGDYAFSKCKSLKEIVIPCGVVSIGNSTFSGCDKLISVIISDSVISIGRYAFSDCTSLSSIHIPFQINTIQTQTFSGCNNLNTVAIPSGVTCIDICAFDDCNILADVYYSGTQKQWEAVYIASGNSNLTSATIHYNTNVGSLSFSKAEYTSFVGAEVFLCANLVAGDLTTEELEETITWNSSNEEVFPIDMNNTCFLPYGLVTAETFISGTPKAPGTAIVTVTIGGVSASCKVTVTAAGEMTLTMSDADEVYTIAQGSRGYLYADITAYDGSSSAKWTTSNKEVAAFDMSGTASKDGIVALKTLGGTDADCSVNFYARSVGTATVTCTLSNGLTASRQITVLPAEQADNEPVVEKNPYNVPQYSDPADERVEKYLNQYQGEWYEAYINYLDSLKEAIAKKEKENLGNGLSISIDEQAKIMMETDEERSASYLSFPLADLSGTKFPEEWKLYAYQALCEMLTDSADNKLDFSNIDLSDEFKASTGIVKEIASKMSNYTSSFNYGSVTVEVNCGRYFGATFGTMTCSGKIKGITRDFQIVVCTDINTNRQIIADYLNELRDLSVKSLYNIYDALAKDFLGDTVVGFSEKYFKDKLSHSKIIKTMAKLEGHFSEMGLGCASTLLIAGSEYYSKATALCDKVLNNKNYDITKDLNALASINIEDNTITDKIVDKCAKKLAKATEKLEAALREYLASGTIKEWNDDAWDFVKNIFNCPVSVTVYNSAGEIVGYAGEDDIWHTDDIRIEEKGEGKIVHTPAGQEYSFKVTGTGHGAVNCTVEQWKDDEPIGRSNYYDIPVDVGTELTTTLSANVADIITPVFTSEGVDFEADEYIPVTANGRVTVNAEASNQEHGRVMGNGLYTRGDTVVLCAIPEDGYRFCGWYTENDELVMVSASFSFAAREDVSYTAHFAEIIPSLENYMVEINESYADVYDVEITQDGEAFTLHLQQLDSSVDMTELKALFAEYTADGKMTETHVLEGKVGENGMEFAGIVAGDHCKLFLLDGNCVPIIEACISR